MIHHRRIPCLIATGLVLLLVMAPARRGIASLYALQTSGLDDGTRVQRLTGATARDPDNDTYWSILGNTYARMLSGGVTGPVTDAARTAFSRECELVPDDYRPWWNLGMLELNARNPQAITCLERAEKLYPTLASIKGWLALACVYVSGNTATAEAKAAEALAITPGDSYAVTAQGFCALARGETARAEELFTGVAKQGFTNKFVYFGLSLCCRARGDTAMERSELVYSHRINPNLAEAEARLRHLSR